MWEKVDGWVSFAARWIAVLGFVAAVVTTAGGWAEGAIDKIIDLRIKKAIDAHEDEHPGDSVLPLDVVIMTEKDCASLPGWVPYIRASGRLPVGSGTGVDINGVGRTFRVDADDTMGEYEHKLTVSEAPAHRHMFKFGAEGGGTRRGAGGPSPDGEPAPDGRNRRGTSAQQHASNIFHEFLHPER